MLVTGSITTTKLLTQIISHNKQYMGGLGLRGLSLEDSKQSPQQKEDNQFDDHARKMHPQYSCGDGWVGI